jgi:hypothetical protein
LKKLFKLLVFVLVANAAYQFAPTYVRYTKFKQDLPDLALQAKGKADWTITSEVLQLAAKHKVPLEQGDVQIRRTTDLEHTYIDTAWVEEIAFVPKWKYPMRFTAMADGWHIKPTIIEELRR